MKRFWIILLVLGLFVPALAQEDAASAAFERLIPSNVRLRLNEETGAALIFNASPAVCEPLVTNVSIEGRVIDVDAYVPLSAEETNCNFIAPYEPVIELGQLEPDVSYVLLLNDFVTSFFVPQSDGVIMDMPVAMLWGEDNPLYGSSRVDAYIDSVELSADEDNTLNIHLIGAHPDGCLSEEFTWVRQDDINPLIYHIEVFRLIPEGVMCPMELQDLDITITTELPADSSFYIEAGDHWLSYSPEETLPISNFPVSMDSVTIVAEDDQYSVTLKGGTPDCDGELSEVVGNEDFASFITISLFTPFESPCQMGLKPYEAVFTVETLPVIVNGVAYDENGIIAPISQAAGRPDLGQGGGGNLMQVDTVIESVDVLILESFPMQINISVKGYQPDGCDLPVIVEQSREDNVVTVHVYREVPADVMCTMMIVPYEETISLEGGFEGGTVEIHVNDFTTTVDL